MLVSKNGIAHLITFKILQSSLFGLAAPCEIDVKIQKVENRKNGTIKDKQGQTYKAPVFMVSFYIKNSYSFKIFIFLRMERISRVKSAYL